MRNPDFTNQHIPVKVWRLPIDRGARSEPDHEAGLASWLIESTAFHPAWNQWLVSVIHLRDIPGVRPAIKQFPDADHEWMVISLNPERPCDVDEMEATGSWGDPDVPKFLTPIDQSVQFAGLSDAQAVEVGEYAIRAIVAGEASPDQDYRGWWAGAIERTVHHYRSAGTHVDIPEGRA